jgi:lipoprotein-anchoring transpeptidase ErfK/SrfK
MSGLIFSAACTGEGAKQAASGTTSTSSSSAASTSSTPPPAASATIAMSPAAGTVDMGPATPITLKTTGTITAVEVKNPEGTPVVGTLSPDRKTWRTKEPLGYGKTYTVKASARNADGVSAPFSGSVSTVQPSNLTHAYVTPGEDGVYGVGQPVVVRFDEPIVDRAAALKAMTVKTTPAVSGSWFWFSNQEAHWRPKQFYAPGTKVSVDVKVYGVKVGDGLYGQDDTHSQFSIGDKMVSKVDNNEMQLRVYKNDVLVATMPASLGRPQYPTQNGIHVVQEKYTMKIMDSSTWGLPTDSPGGYRTEVPYATRISGSGEFVHSAPWSVGDQGYRNVSHGCINVSYDNGVWFYNNSKPGDIVVVTGSTAELQMGDAYMDWNVAWATWAAGGSS